MHVPASVIGMLRSSWTGHKNMSGKIRKLKIKCFNVTQKVVFKVFTKKFFDILFRQII